MKTADVIIVGSGASGLFNALFIPQDYKVIVITKKEVEESDSFLAQGGISALKNPEDYDSYFEDTMKAGHYENDKGAVEKMIKESPQIIQDLKDFLTLFFPLLLLQFTFSKNITYYNVIVKSIFMIYD